jgi:hypothetical protein
MNSTTEPQEKVFYENSNDLVSDSRLRFGGTTLFLREVTGTSTAMIPAHPISHVLMRVSLLASWVCAFFFLWFLLPVTIGIYLMTLRAGLQETGRVYVNTSRGRILLTEVESKLPWEPFLHILGGSGAYQWRSREPIGREMHAIQEAISKAIAAKQT